MTSKLENHYVSVFPGIEDKFYYIKLYLKTRITKFSKSTSHVEIIINSNEVYFKNARKVCH
jgi:hypothetical protein